ncbi:MAG: hypothetical protein A2259_00910 [Candidatus Moranbacteria bacterium RIFOXYA2_FULL_43_15]|nr:MAG: hypothetical protein A2259_00910 [Candidatus Moranbacteria bacterium RIFOXYA2_FULL_43_15]
MKKENFDVAVIGGGPAGMMAAIRAGQSGARVALIEKNQTLGKKLFLTGNGRCNITQTGDDIREFIKKIGKNGKFLFSALSIFGPKETMDFFETFGLKLKTEKNGRVFPLSDRATDVRNALIKALKQNGVKIIFGQDVSGFKIEDKKIEYLELAGKKKIHARNFILAVGGKSYPTTGSTGDWYQKLEKIGHTVITPAPALVPIETGETWIKELQGISLKNIIINLTANDRKTSIGSGEIIFTHFGLSGPAVINASKTIGQHLKSGPVALEMDLLPTLNNFQLEEKFKADFENNKKKDLKNYLSVIFPEKIAFLLIKLAEIEKDQKIHSLTKTKRNHLARAIKSFPITATALLDFNHAMITSGGVNLKEVDPKTMRSKIVSNLSFAGEILDLDGPTGGYNLQIAWSTGHAAGAWAIK